MRTNLEDVGWAFAILMETRLQQGNQIPMRKSQNVTLTILAAAALAGCGNNVKELEVKRCIDGNGVMQDDGNCNNNSRYGLGQGRYRYVYGGNGGYTPGSVVTGARETPSPGIESVDAAVLAARGVTSGGARVGMTSNGFTTAPSARGGFGAHGSGADGGGGE
jgi:hypothetical protein